MTMMPSHKISKPGLIALVVISLFIASGCGLPFRLLPGSQPTATAVIEATVTSASTAVPVPTQPPTDDEIIRAIQETMDEYARAYNENDVDLLTRVVDQTNPPFRRLVKNRFEEFQQSSYAGEYDYNYQVVSIQHKGELVIAHILSFDVAAADWPFRNIDGRWMLSEPTVEEAGAMVTREDEHFIFETYPWADDVNSEIIEMLETAAKQVDDKIGAIPTGKLRVRIRPSYSVDPFADPNSIAHYDSGADQNMDAIHIYVPYSFAFDNYLEEVGWQATLQQTITHEYTHFAHRRAFDGAGRLMDWVSEGMAEYASESGRIREAYDAAYQGELIPIVDASDAVYKQDLMHLYLLEKDVSLGYAESQALVEYIVREYGGIEKVWELARTHDDLQDLDKALQQTLGVTYAEFDQDWRTWLGE